MSVATGLSIRFVEGEIHAGQAGGPPEFRMSARGYRLGDAMEALKTVNTLEDESGKPLHALAMYEGYSLLSCWQNHLVYPYLLSWAQFPELFDWLDSRGWPRIHIEGALPGELAAALLRIQEGGPGKDRFARDPRVFAGGLALPTLWARSAKRRGSTLVVYTPDLVSDRKHGCDFRFSKVHEWMGAHGLAFSEIFHLTDPAKAWKNARTRGRLPLYLELWGLSGGPRRLPALCLEGLPAGLRGMLQRVLPGFLARCVESRRRVEGLRGVLRASGARLLLSMDDYRSSQELIMACRLEGVRAVWIQHGLLTRFNPGLVPAGIPETAMAAPDRFFARAPFWMGVLETYAPRLARMAKVVSGLDAPADGTSGSQAPARALPKPGEPLVVLFLLETLWDPAEAACFLGKMLDDPRLRVHFKIRPDMDREKQIRPYFGAREPHVVALDLAPELERSHVVVGSHSSLLYKLLEWRKPVFRLATSFEYGEQLSRFGLVDDLALTDDFHARFTEALGRGPEVYEKRWTAYQGEAPQQDFREALREELDLTRC